MISYSLQARFTISIGYQTSIDTVHRLYNCMYKYNIRRMFRSMFRLFQLDIRNKLDKIVILKFIYVGAYIF